MVIDTASGSVVFVCNRCGRQEAGNADDAQIASGVFSSSEQTTMYQTLIETASLDRTNLVVAKKCDKCGLDYMTQIRVGESEVVIYKCKCGNYVRSA